MKRTLPLLLTTATLAAALAACGPRGPGRGWCRIAGEGSGGGDHRAARAARAARGAPSPRRTRGAPSPRRSRDPHDPRGRG
jgi:hypothetical protein